MSPVDVALQGIVAVISDGLILSLLSHAFAGQTKAPSDLTEDALKRLIGSTGRATAEVTESTGTVHVNSEQYSAKTSKGIIQKVD